MTRRPSPARDQAPHRIPRPPRPMHPARHPQPLATFSPSRRSHSLPRTWALQVHRQCWHALGPTGGATWGP
jgi:hypothetical protein